MLNELYEIKNDSPKPIEWEKYCEEILKDYQKLLNNHQNNESAFQKFFEENPSFIPGAFEIFGCSSGHYPFMHGIISQPEIGTIFRRKPDFVWLAQDSLTFAPVFIEIEKPSKKMFNMDQTTTADFNQALTQIKQWEYLLSDSKNREVLYDYFDLPLDIRKKKFSPQFLLIYGRRDEYKDDELLTGVRATYKTNFIDIMSYDRLKPDYEYQQFVSYKISNHKYKVINIPATYRYKPTCAEILSKMYNFNDKIELMKYTSEERKLFLKNRYQYWYDFGKLEQKGLMNTQDFE